jgi:hypothetical protein
MQRTVPFHALYCLRLARGASGLRPGTKMLERGKGSETSGLRPADGKRALRRDIAADREQHAVCIRFTGLRLSGCFCQCKRLPPAFQKRRASVEENNSSQDRSHSKESEEERETGQPRVGIRDRVGRKGISEKIQS